MTTSPGSGRAAKKAPQASDDLPRSRGGRGKTARTRRLRAGRQEASRVLLLRVRHHPRASQERAAAALNAEHKLSLPVWAREEHRNGDVR